jgi:hypothetical protein
VRLTRAAINQVNFDFVSLIKIAATNIYYNVYRIVFDISKTMTNLDIVSLRSDVTLSKPPYLKIVCKPKRTPIIIKT